MYLVKKYFPLAFAVIFAMLSSVSVYQLLKDREGVSEAAPADAMPIVVAKHSIGIGEKLADHDLEIITVPQSQRHEESFSSARSVIGRTARANIQEGKPILGSALLEGSENFASLIPAQMRAVTVSVQRSEAMMQFLERGTLVDVLSLFFYENTGLITAEVIVEKARVLAVHKAESDGGAKGAGKRSQMEVTLIVTPQEAKWIVAAMNQGGVDLVVRNDQAALNTVG